MKILNFKSIMIMAALYTAIILPAFLNADCDMMAMIAKREHYISWINSRSDDYNFPYDFFDFIRERSTNSGWKPNNDGYGFSYYPEDGSFYFNPTNPEDPDNQAWYLTGEDGYYYNLYDPNDPDNLALDTAETVIMNNNTEASIVYGHARAAGEDYVYGSHPFRFEWNGKTYTFIHNGGLDDGDNDLREKVIEYLGPTTWSYPSNWTTSAIGDDWIDSELLFHYLMKHIIEENGDILYGIHNALNYSGGYPQNNVWELIYNPGNYYNIINFVLSDGESLYLFRNRNDNTHRYSYKEYNGFYAVKTYADMIGGETLNEKELAVISPYGVTRIPNIMKDVINQPPMKFVRGELTDDLDCFAIDDEEPRLWFTGNVTIPTGATVNIIGEPYEGTHIGFASNITLTIDGTLNINDGAGLHINHSSEVLIDTDGLLFLDWGSTITGTTPTTYGATPPGQPAGGEEVIPGDRIIAQNGGIITTDDDYLSPGNVITISSNSEHIWDGIFIKNPSDLADYWFVNCDISGIRKLSIENIGESRNTANLNLHLTDFHDAGQIVVRDGHNLYIHGSTTDLCYFQNNTPIPICAYESPVDISYCWIGGTENNPELGNGGGIYLYDSATPLSIINNCNFMYNNSDGVKLNGVAFNQFNNNNIENNTGFGMLCYPSTSFLYDDFNSNTLSDNGFAEYAGWQNTFRMDNPNANITIEDSDYGSGSDQYLLMDILWDGINPVDISGTNITLADLPHLSPSDPDAWTFGEEVPIERLMLYSASNDMSNGNYSYAEQTLQQIIVDYPLTQEAGIAVYYLYHLENITDQDFPDLRNYLENISVVTDTPLEKAVEKIITKTYMKDKDYLTAIDRLETVINNSQIPDEVIMAMIDEGYCYMELSDGGERGLPANCTIKTATLDEYQAKVRELESQFSFYPEEQDQESVPIAGNILSLTNFPNPFNPSTTISFSLKNSSNVKLTVYNVKGQKVTTLIDKHFENGSHTITWNGNDSNNKAVASGIYFYKLSAGKSSAMKKMLLLK